MNDKDRIFIPHKRVRLPHNHFEPSVGAERLMRGIVLWIVICFVAFAVLTLFRVHH